MTRRERVHTAIAYVAGVVWQLQVAWTAARAASVLRSLLGGLGAELPNLTALYMATARWWFLVAILSAAAAADVLRREHPSIRHSAVVLAVMVFIGLLMQAFATEAFFLPLFALTRQVG